MSQRGYLNIVTSATHTHKNQNTHTPTILGEFGGADQGGDAEAVSRADWQASSTPGHAVGVAAQRLHLVGVAMLVAGRGQRQVAVHIFHALAVTLRGQREGVIFNPIMLTTQ